MAHKVAVNFPIKDDDVYNNLVVPYKESKDLPGLLEGLIYSYYYSEEFRTLFDEVVYGVEYEVIRDDEEFNAAIKKAQEAVALYDILASSAEDFLNDSMDDINQKLSAVAAVTGGEFEDGAVKVGDKAGEQLEKLRSLMVLGESGDLGERVKTLENSVAEMRGMVEEILKGKNSDKQTPVSETNTENNVAQTEFADNDMEDLFANTDFSAVSENDTADTENPKNEENTENTAVAGISILDDFMKNGVGTTFDFGEE